MIHCMSEWGLTEDQIAIREQVLSQLSRTLPRENILKYDDAERFPAEAYASLAEAGWMGLPFEPRYGGMGLGFRELAILIEALAYYWNGISSAYLTTVVVGGGHLNTYGSDEQKERILPGLIKGEIKLAFCLTEPDAGSDAAAIKTKAVTAGDDWIINGSKVYTTGAHIADYLVVVTKTDGSAGHKGMTTMLVDTRSPGLTIKPLRGLGRRSLHTNQVFFDDVRVCASNVMGKVNEGWPNLMRCLNLERLAISASHVGNCQCVIDYVKNYASERIQFGRPITKFQAIAHKFADMQMLTDSARLLTYRVADMLDAGLSPIKETAMAKVISTENNVKVVDMGMQIMGGASYMMEHEMQMHYRDCRIGPIGAGTNEIQRTIIAKQMGL